MKLFGISLKSLGQFVTSEKDMMKNVNHLPTDYYLIDNEKKSDKKEGKTEEKTAANPDGSRSEYEKSRKEAADVVANQVKSN